MSFGDDLASTLVELREMAEDNMRDQCAITRLDPDAEPGVMDPETGQYPEPARITIYEGKCRIQIKSQIASSSDVDAGERVGTAQEVELQLPVVGSEGAAIDDVVVMTAAAHDSSLVGRAYTVAARHEKSQATARRLRMIEVTS